VIIIVAGMDKATSRRARVEVLAELQRLPRPPGQSRYRLANPTPVPFQRAALPAARINGQWAEGRIPLPRDGLERVQYSADYLGVIMKAKDKARECQQALKAKCLALEQENLRLHRKIAKLEAQVVSAGNGTLARLENTPSDKLTDEELTYIIRKGEEKH
jgi:hypothetical protein